MSDKPIYVDPDSGISVSSNGSAAANSFMAGFMQSVREEQALEAELIAKAKLVGAVTFIKWDGFFCLEENGYKPGGGQIMIGSLAKFTEAYGKTWGELKPGAMVALRHNLNDKHVSFWKINDSKQEFWGKPTHLIECLSA